MLQYMCTLPPKIFLQTYLFIFFCFLATFAHFEVGKTKIQLEIGEVQYMRTSTSTRNISNHCHSIDLNLSFFTFLCYFQAVLSKNSTKIWFEALQNTANPSDIYK